AWSLVSAAGELTVIALAASAAGVALAPGTILLAMVAINVGSALPMPGHLGVLEAAVVLALATAGIPATVAITVAVAYRLAHVVALATLGLPMLPWVLRRAVAAAPIALGSTAR
ncbi:MAG TPA: hypothetical protein VHE35_35545, partial [Kofleriaceae bacterium]|nr:hypothetical protein [Kofleriaceae bacterium]